MGDDEFKLGVVQRLTRIETKVDDALQAIQPVSDDHEKRLRSLERERWTWRGGLAAVVALLIK